MFFITVTVRTITCRFLISLQLLTQKLHNNSSPILVRKLEDFKSESLTPPAVNRFDLLNSTGYSCTVMSCEKETDFFTCKCKLMS